MRRVTLALLLASGAAAFAGPAQAGPLQEVLARAAPQTETVQIAQRGDRSNRGQRQSRNRNDNRPSNAAAQPQRRDSERRDWNDRRDDRNDRSENRSDRRNWNDRRDDRRDWRNDSRHDSSRDRRDDRRDWARNDHRDYRDWNHTWRNDRRYDWRTYRNRYRSIYRPSVRYYAPYSGYRYSRFNIGIRIGSGFYGSRYQIGDPWRYRLPPARGYLRWVRYYDDVMLIDIRDGYVVDVIYDFFW